MTKHEKVKYAYKKEVLIINRENLRGQCMFKIVLSLIHFDEFTKINFWQFHGKVFIFSLYEKNGKQRLVSNYKLYKQLK